MKNIFETLFSTPEKKAQAAVDLQNLLSHPGWQIIDRMLRENIAYLEDIILNTNNESDKDKDAINEARKDRSRFLFLLELPKNQIESLLNDVMPKDEFDPYLTSEEIEINKG